MALTLTACSKDSEEPTLEGSAECSYRVTIDGMTTLPNEFGVDRIAITGGRNEDGSEDVLAFAISPNIKDGGTTSYMVGLVRGLFNGEMAEGTYPVEVFSTSEFGTAEYQPFPLYATNDGEGAQMVTFTLLENSEDRIRMKISGSLTKFEEVDGEVVEVGLFPVEAELTVGRKYYAETQVEGALLGGAVCDCQE